MLTIQKTYARAIAGLLTKAFVVKDKMFFALIFLVHKIRLIAQGIEHQIPILIVEGSNPSKPKWKTIR